MNAQRANTSQEAAPWAPCELRVALLIAASQAAHGARRMHLHRADRDDLRQDILLALLERRGQFNPSRGAWGTFAGVVARTVVSDRSRLRRRACAADVGPDLERFPAGASVTQQEGVDPDLYLDLQRVAAELPGHPAALLQLLMTVGDVAAAQRADARSSTAFYRALADLRCWLRASGMRPQPRGVRGCDPVGKITPHFRNGEVRTHG